MTVKFEDVAGTDDNLAGLKHLLDGWRCCGSPGNCGAKCQDDPLSAVLAAAYREVDLAISERKGDDERRKRERSETVQGRHRLVEGDHV